MPFYPGPGLGGHCIPIDPLYLSWKARLVDTKSQFIELADDVNRSVPRHVVSKLNSTLNDEQKCLNGSEICLLGVAYKSNVSDVRESPAIIIAEDLREHQANVTYCDPHVESFDVHGNTVPKIRQDQLNDKDFDLGVILTGHEDFDWPEIADSFSTFLDTRNAFPDELKTDRTRVVNL
jgi:UDP-N-acetyl-D-glucosamine dehydrogenase